MITTPCTGRFSLRISGADDVDEETQDDNNPAAAADAGSVNTTTTYAHHAASTTITIAAIPAIAVAVAADATSAMCSFSC